MINSLVSHCRDRENKRTLQSHLVMAKVNKFLLMYVFFGLWVFFFFQVMWLQVDLWISITVCYNNIIIWFKNLFPTKFVSCIYTIFFGRMNLLI